MGTRPLVRPCETDWIADGSPLEGSVASLSVVIGTLVVARVEEDHLVRVDFDLRAALAGVGLPAVLLQPTADVDAAPFATYRATASAVLPQQTTVCQSVSGCPPFDLL